MIKNLLIALCILSIVAMAGWKLSEGYRESKKEQELLFQSSDARKFKRVIRVQGDDWLGYMVFRSRIFQEELAQRNLGLEFKIETDFRKRFQALAKGDCDFVVATIDSYLLNGQATNYPGVITFVIDESFGGDCVVGGPQVQSLDDLRSPNRKGAYVGYSPSEFLLKSQVSHFDLTDLKKKLPKYRVDSAEEAFQKLKQGSVDFAVLWEPFVSSALDEIPGTSRLIDTSQVQDLIVDVAIASRKLVVEDPQLVEQVTEAYFTALATLLNNQELLLSLTKADSGLSKEKAASLLAGVRLTNYGSNQNDWFPVGPNSTNRLSQSIKSIESILIDLGEIKQGSQPATKALMNSQTLTNLQRKADLNQKLLAGSGGNLPISNSYFSPLPDDRWKELVERTTGTLLEKPITFQSGSSEVPYEFKELLTTATEKLKHYPYHRLIVRAHVSPGSDSEVDQQLSQERADSIRSFLINETAVQPERIRSLGIGSQEVLERKSGESLRAWKRRCRRAQVLLVAD